jgi:MSHA pilin protein MshA
MILKKQNGFTLMELIIVIIILGILAAYAVPKYMSLDTEARASTTKALAGGVLAAAEMVHGVALAKRISASTNADLGSGTHVTITAASYPSANNSGISAALSSLTGFTTTIVNNAITYSAEGASGDCSVTYEIDPADDDATPTITRVNTGC